MGETQREKAQGRDRRSSLIMPWLHCPAPRPDELLSSWLHRLALANRRSDHVLCNFMFGRQPIWTRDVDRHFPHEFFPILSDWTRTPVERLQWLSLTSLAGRLSENPASQALGRLLLPLGIYHRVRRRAGLQFCPACLAESPAYARRSWRVALVTVCTRHLCLLQDRCPGCGVAFMFHRMRQQLTGAWPCVNCGLDLRRKTMGARIAPAVVRFQTELCRGLVTGWVRIAGRWLHALAFCEGVHFLLHSLTLRRLGGLDMSSLLWERLARNRGGRLVLEEQTVEVRYALVQVLADWLADWPARPQAALCAYLHQPSVLLADRPTPVFWVQQMLDGVFTPAIPWNEEERASVYEVLAQRGQAASPSNVAALLGVDHAHARAWHLRRAASPTRGTRPGH
jgi:uncharacterized protein (DUF983 family)